MFPVPFGSNLQKEILESTGPFPQVSSSRNLYVDTELYQLELLEFVFFTMFVLSNITTPDFLGSEFIENDIIKIAILCLWIS